MKKVLDNGVKFNNDISGLKNVETAKLIKREVSDGIIAPDYTQEALDILKQKKNGGYIILVGKKDKDYTNEEVVEFKEVNGCAVMQSVNRAKANISYFENKLSVVIINPAFEYKFNEIWG